MNRFASLAAYQPGLDAGATQTEARRRLPGLLGGVYPLRYWRPGDPFPAEGQRLLIGTVVWSTPELRLLDLIEDRLADPECPPVVVDVFDADEYPSVDAIRKVVPGVEVMHQSPFVGLWVDGVLTEVAAGYLGRRLIAKIVGFDPGHMDAHIFRRTQFTQPCPDPTPASRTSSGP